MRAFAWLGPAAALVVGFLTGTATSTDAPPTPACVDASPHAAAPDVRCDRSKSTDVELSRALRRVIAALPAAPDLAVGAPIRGTVADADGRPAAGVVVRARPEIDAPDDDEEEDEATPIADVAARRLRWLRRMRDGTLTATSLDDGTFRVEGVHAGLTYGLDVRTDGLVLDSRASSRDSEVHAGDAVSLVVERRCALTVTIEGACRAQPVVETAETSDSDGKPDFHAQTWSPTRPTIWVRPGSYLVRAFAGDDLTDVVAATVDGGCEAQARLSLVAGGRIDCDVGWPRGLDRASVDVTATPAAGPSDRSPVAGELQADGRVTLRRLLPGRWTVSISYPSHRVVETRDVDVAAGICNRPRFELAEPDARDFVLVRVLDEGGVPVTGADVRSNDQYFCTSSDGSRAAETTTGVYRAFHAGRPEIDHHFYVSAGVGSEYETTDYVPGESVEVVVKLPCMTPLDVRIGAGLSVWVKGRDGRTWGADDGTGIASLGLRRKGDVLLVRSDDCDSAMLVRVPSSGVVDWAPRPLRALRVSSLKDGSAWDAGLRVGDLIVGVDGEEFRDAPHREAAWAAALARGRCRLDVMRGDERLWIAMDASLFRHDRAGADLAPWVR